MTAFAPTDPAALNRAVEIQRDIAALASELIDARELVADLEQQIDELNGELAEAIAQTVRGKR